MEKIFKTLVFGLLLVVTPFFASAATMSFSPSSKNIKAGNTFTVGIVVNSESRAMNAASGLISFDKDILEATGISKSGSIISLWAEEPTRSNSNGTINFEGIALSPGYTGSNGNLFTVTFRARKIGDTTLKFTNGSVLANDGTGGNILTEMVPLSLSVSDIVKPKNEDVPQKKTDPSASRGEVIIKSSSHPEEDKWYSDNTPGLSFSLPDDTTEIKTLISNSDTKAPNVSYIPPITEKTIDTLSDGKYYFAISAKTPSGWTSVSRRQINIDTVPPKSFNVLIANETRDRHLPPAIIFNTEDNISDNIRYEIKVGDGDIIKTTEHKTDDPYLLTSLNPGAHVVTVSAYDEAGNVRSETAGFIIEAIATPKIVTFPNDVTSGTREEIKGITYPNATLYFNYKSGEKTVVEETTKSNEKGDFSMPVTGKLKSGVYILTVRVQDQTGARSNETAPVIISFKPLYASMSFILYVIILIVVIVSVSSAVFMWKRTETINKKNKHKSRTLTKEAEGMTEKSFEILREGVVERIATLKAMRPKRKYIDDEISFLQELESDLLEARVLIVDDIHKMSDIDSD
jgi:hypothetical protein